MDQKFPYKIKRYYRSSYTKLTELFLRYLFLALYWSHEEHKTASFASFFLETLKIRI
jgi:hypothetical protein